MRIAVDVRPLNGPWGGVRRYTVELVRALSRIDSHNEYALCALPEHWAEELELGNNFDGHPPRNTMIRMLDQVRLTSVSTPIDLFHGTNYAAPLITNYPSVITVHDLSVALFPQTHPWKRRLRHRLLPRLCQRASRLIADSQNTKRDLVRLFGLPPEKIEVIYLAVGENIKRVTNAEALDAVRRRYDLPDTFNLFVGSIEPRKNLNVLLEATRALKEDGREHRLVIAGMPETGYLAQLQRAMRSLGLEEGEDIYFTGPVDDRHLASLYSLCTLFVYPSLYEGFGLPPLEAMACQVPVLVPNNSSLSELYGECGALFDLERPDGLVNTMRALLDSPNERAELAERGLKLAETRNWDNIASETLSVYESAVGGL
jgi:glycosyltransferase involved in cell wall biosynthesis